MVSWVDPLLIVTQQSCQSLSVRIQALWQRRDELADYFHLKFIALPLLACAGISTKYQGRGFPIFVNFAAQSEDGYFSNERGFSVEFSLQGVSPNLFPSL